MPTPTEPTEPPDQPAPPWPGAPDPPSGRRRFLVLALVVLLFGVGLGAAVGVWRLGGATVRAVGAGGDEAAPPPARRQAPAISDQQLQAAGCTGVREFADAGRDHLAEDQQPSNWNSNPPTSGDHLGVWLQPGIYPEEQDERRVVHSLEHGYVVVQYKNLPEDQVRRLTARAPALGEKLIVQPWAGLSRDGVALSAWQVNQVCATVDPQVVDAFISRFMAPNGRESVAPEPFAG
jgi:hypothetical protein